MITCEPLAIHGSAASAFMAYLAEESQIEGITAGNISNIERLKEEAMAVVHGDAASIDGPGSPSKSVNVAVVQMSGPLFKSNWYFLGSDYITYLLETADRDPNISAIVLVMNCLGGAVTASEALADSIAGLSKPIVTYVDKAACSGGYWAASKTDFIMVNGKTAMLGSIGTMTTIVQTNAKSTDTYKVFELYASTSGKKNSAMRELAKGKDAQIIARLDEMDAIFMDTVKEARTGVLDEANTLDGQDYLTEKALEYGLADGVGTLQDAVNKAADLAASGLTKKGKQDMALFGTDLPKDIKALVGQPASAVTDQALAAANAALKAEKIEGFELVKVENVTALQAEAANLQSANADLSNKLTDANSKLATAQSELASAITRAEAAEAKAATYGAQPGAKPAAPVSTKESEAKGNNDEPTYACEADRLAAEADKLNETVEL